MAEREYTVRVEPYEGRDKMGVLKVGNRMYLATVVGDVPELLHSYAENMIRIGIKEGLLPSEKPFQIQPLKSLEVLDES